MSYDALRTWLKRVLPAQIDAIAGRTTRLDLGERPIVLFDVRRLIHFLKSDFGVEITGVYARHEAIHRFAERELKLKLFSDAPPAPDRPAAAPVAADTDEAPVPAPIPSPDPPPPPPAPSEELTPVPTASHDDGSRRVLPVWRTLRSGSQVRFDGDVQVYGDVNPGAVVVATGSIMVLGALKGVAHAGAHGDDKAFILAFDMRPTQLRIARNIAIPPTATPRAAPSPRWRWWSITRSASTAFHGRIPT